MERPKWQYLVDKATAVEAIEIKLGAWGQNGWELVQVFEDASAGTEESKKVWTMIFKQPGL